MFDILRSEYQFRCPNDPSEWASVPVSKIRVVRRFRGATSPAVFRVTFDCPCGDEHETLVPHDRLDLDPIGVDSPTPVLNLATGTREPLGRELGMLAQDMLKQGHWPWEFWCHPESQRRPGFPSSLRVVAPVDHSTDDEVPVGVVVRCNSCHRLSVNFVSRRHLDVPYFSDPQIRYVRRLFGDDVLSESESLRQRLTNDWLDGLGITA